MPSSYTPLLRLTLPADGELVGTWGQTVNNGITSLEEAAIAGVANIALADANRVLTVANGAADEARNAVLQITGALTAQRDIIIPNNTKTYFVRNSTTGGFGVRIKTAAGVGIVVPANGATLVYCDGVNVGQAITASGALTVTDINGTPDLILKASGVERMRILANGNVGIGTVAPQSLLSVGAGHGVKLSVGVAWAQPKIIETDYDGADFTRLHVPGAAANPTRYELRSTGEHVWSNTAERMRIDAAGNVGIGTSAPGQKLHVEGNILRLSAQGPSYGLLMGRGSFLLGGAGAQDSALWATDGALLFGTGSSAERMRIDSAGNVGIGTTGPAARLAVAGNMRADCGNLTVVSLTLTGGQSNLQVAHTLNSGRVDLFNTGSGGVTITDGLVGVFLANGAQAWAAQSDERVKTDLRPLEEACAKVATLRAVSGRYVKDAEQGYTRRRIFLIAQDVQRVLPEAVYKMEGDDMLHLAYTEVIPLLVAAVKELTARIATLEAV
jgi:hypothetical protein